MNTLIALGLTVLASFSPNTNPLKPVRVEPAYETVVKPASSIDRLVNASFQLSKNGQPYCSGQFISPTVFLTASHCVVNGAGEVNETDQFTIALERYGAEQVFALKVDKVSTTYDTATLSLVDPNTAFPYVQIAPKDTVLVPGETVVNVSFPGVENFYFITQGTFTAETDEALDGLVSDYAYIVAIDTIGGSSGSGLYIKRDGEYFLIGTLQGGPPAHDYMNWFSILRGVYAVI